MTFKPHLIEQLRSLAAADNEGDSRMAESLVSILEEAYAAFKRTDSGADHAAAFYVTLSMVGFDMSEDE
jgi:hypothetical protein